MSFRNRDEAGHRLADALKAYRGKNVVVLALPRGGVPVAVPVAAALGVPLELLIVRKIGLPWHPELAMGAVVYGVPPVVVRNEDVIERAAVSPEQFAQVLGRETAEAKRRFDLYEGGRAQPAVEDRTAIIVDDGIATGASMRAAVSAVRQRHPASIIVATPVAATSTLDLLRAEADDVVCLEPHPDLGAIGYYYEDFGQVGDAAVIRALQPPEAR